MKRNRHEKGDKPRDTRDNEAERDRERRRAEANRVNGFLRIRNEEIPFRPLRNENLVQVEQTEFEEYVVHRENETPRQANRRQINQEQARGIVRGRGRPRGQGGPVVGRHNVPNDLLAFFERNPDQIHSNRDKIVELLLKLDDDLLEQTYIELGNKRFKNRPYSFIPTSLRNSRVNVAETNLERVRRIPGSFPWNYVAMDQHEFYLDVDGRIIKYTVYVWWWAQRIIAVFAFEGKPDESQVVQMRTLTIFADNDHIHKGLRNPNAAYDTNCIILDQPTHSSDMHPSDIIISPLFKIFFAESSTEWSRIPQVGRLQKIFDEALAFAKKIPRTDLLQTMVNMIPVWELVRDNNGDIVHPIQPIDIKEYLQDPRFHDDFEVMSVTDSDLSHQVFEEANRTIQVEDTQVEAHIVISMEHEMQRGHGLEEVRLEVDGGTTYSEVENGLMECEMQLIQVPVNTEPSNIYEDIYQIFPSEQSVDGKTIFTEREEDFMEGYNHSDSDSVIDNMGD